MKTIQEILRNVKKTSYGLRFIPITKEEWEIIEPHTKGTNWTDYDKRQVKIQLMNCPFAFLDIDYFKPIDNEYDLEELYQMAERNEI